MLSAEEIVGCLGRNLARFGSRALAGGLVQKVNEFRFYDLGLALGSVKSIDPSTPWSSCYWQLWRARQALLSLLADPLTIRVCKPAALKIIAAVDAVLPRDLGAMVKKYYANQDAVGGGLVQLDGLLKTFEPILSAECESLGTYVISRKGIYSTNELIERADEALPEETRSLVSAQVIQDLREAGKCLAFDADTACGFHLMRATEGVIHAYYVAVTGHSPNRKDRNWGAYVRNLNRHRKINPGSKADPKLIVLIDQVREHHRNVLMHPEVRLSGDEALTLFGVCHSAIVAFAAGLKSATP